MASRGTPGSTSGPRSLRSVEILTTILEGGSVADYISPAQSPAAAPDVLFSPNPSYPPSRKSSPPPSRRTPTPPPASMPSPTVTEILAMSGVHGASARDAAVHDLAHLLRQSRAREEVLRAQLQQCSTVDSAGELTHPDVKGLVARLASAEALLLKKEAELRECRSQGLTLQQVHDPDDAALVASFDDLNARVKVLAQRIRDSLGWSERNTAIDREALRSLRQRNQPAFALVRHFMAVGCAAGRTLGDAAEPLARGLLSAVLSDLVFMRFAPGCDEEQHESACALYRSISAHEPPDISARWRALTYRALRAGTDDVPLLDYIVKTFFLAVYDVFSCTARASPTLRKSDVFLNLRAEAMGIARAALRWRDDAAFREYEAFCPWPLVQLSPIEFRATSSPERPFYPAAGGQVEVVMLATSLGLRVVRSRRTSVSVRPVEGLSADARRLRTLCDAQTSWERLTNAAGMTYTPSWTTTRRY